MTTSCSPSAPPAEYDMIASPLSDLGKSSAKSPSGEPTKLVAIAVDAVPGVTASLNDGMEVGKWSTGLFNCFDFCVPNCFMATFCPCVSVAQIATRIGYKYQTVLIAFGVAGALDCLMYGLLCATVDKTTVNSSPNSDSSVRNPSYAYSEITTTDFTVWGYIAVAISIVIYTALWQLRTKARERFQLPGSCVEDCFVSWCCSCCSIAQMATHVKSYKPHSCDFGPPDELPGYSMQV